MKPPRIGIFGHYGNKNLGDEAIIEAAVENLRKLVPGVELEGLSINPFDTHERYGIDTFPIRYRKNYFDAIAQNNGVLPNTDCLKIDAPNPTANPASQENEQPKGLVAKIKSIWPIKQLFLLLWHLRQAIKGFFTEISFLGKVKERLKNLDMIIVCGSNQFLDNFGGAWGFPYTILKWTLLAKSTGTKVAFVSVGAGPLDRSLSYWMFEKALNKADYVSYRDEGSKKMVEDRVNGVDGPVYPDVAHSLLTQPKENTTSTELPLVSINPMPVFDKRYWYTSDESKYDQYVDSLASFVEHVLKRGNRVALFNTQIKDLDVINDVMAALDKKTDLDKSNLSVLKHELLQELIDTLGKSDMIVATRFHATVLPLRLGKPVLGICYYRKAQELLDDIGLNNYHVDINDFSYEQLRDKFDHMADNIDDARNQVKTRYKNYHEAKLEQWRNVVGLLEPANAN